MKDYDVFISYSSIDAAAANRLLEILENHGLRCWIAPRNIPSGTHWADEIDTAITQSSVFVVLVSTHSMASHQVPKEIALAVNEGAKIFPLRIDDISLQGSFRYYLSDCQFTDATGGFDAKCHELAEGILAAIGKEEGVRTAQKTGKTAAPSPAPSTPSAPSAPKSFPLIPVLAGAALLILVLGGVFFFRREDKPEPAPEPLSQAEAEQAAQAAATEAQAAEPQADTETQEAEAAEPQADTKAAETAEAEETTETEAVSSAFPLFGRWELIGYEDRGCATNFSIRTLCIGADGSFYESAGDAYAQAADGTALPVLQVSGSLVNFTEAADIGIESAGLTTEYTLEDSFSGDVSMKKDSMPTISPIVVTFNHSLQVGRDRLPEDNPTQYTYESLYAGRYLRMTITGSSTNDPLHPVDTVLVWQRAYPILGKELLPTLFGTWTDTLGNRWSFAPGEGAPAFTMTAGDAVYEGSSILFSSADPEAENFFERVEFVFEGLNTDRYAVISYDGDCLTLLDEKWQPFVLTRDADPSGE